MVFSEPVTGFDSSDISLAGTTTPGAVAGVSGSGATYTVSISGMTTSGFVIASIIAGAATDVDEFLPSEASTSTDNRVSFVNDPPTVTINQGGGQVDPTNGTPILFNVVFSEPVTGFASGDISLAGTTTPGAVAGVSGSGATYTVSISGMTTSGAAVASIIAAAATDAAGNPARPPPAPTTPSPSTTWRRR